MVAHPRTSLGAGDMRPLSAAGPGAALRSLGAAPRRPLHAAQLRPLNAPSPLRVDLDEQGRVVAIWRQGRLTPRPIAAVLDRWRIDDEWWREHPIARMYYALLLDDGTYLTVYHDLAADIWFEQRS